ncbi:hypothetical protein ACSBR2_025112 [Camellia fascicularis]
MSEIDSSDDGFIDLHDSKELRDAFDLHHHDGNGLISAKELHAVLKNLGEKCLWRDCLKMIKSLMLMLMLMAMDVLILNNSRK